jgi:hypothetical protein
MRATVAVAARRSPRNLGKTTPREMRPSAWPARPTRCKPAATVGGASIWMTRSTAPMSMPSSSELVATMHGRLPALSRSSMPRRWSCASEPWWASAISSPASSLIAAARRSARRRALAKIIVLLWARTSSTRRGWMLGQIDLGGPVVSLPASSSKLGPAASPRRDMSSTGTSMVTSMGRRLPASTTPTGRGAPLASIPPRKRATVSRGRAVADRPMRCIGGTSGPRPRTRSASSRSSESARWAPRLVPVTAWISSRMSTSTDARRAEASEVSKR